MQAYRCQIAYLIASYYQGVRQFLLLPILSSKPRVGNLTVFSDLVFLVSAFFSAFRRLCTSYRVC